MNKTWIVSALSLAAVTATASTAAVAAVINFDAQGLFGPKTFNLAGNAQPLVVETNAGRVRFEGGVILSNVTNLPANSSSIYGTANNITNIDNNPTRRKSLTIEFENPVENFFLDVFNGVPVPQLNYTVADDIGNAATFELASNNQSGFQKIGFPAAGRRITITPDTSAAALEPEFAAGAYDFLIDNITFNTALPNDLLNPVDEVSMPVPTQPAQPQRPALPMPAPTPVLPGSPTTPQPTQEDPTPIGAPTEPVPVAVPEPAGILGLLAMSALGFFKAAKQ